MPWLKKKSQNSLQILVNAPALLEARLLVHCVKVFGMVIFFPWQDLAPISIVHWLFPWQIEGSSNAVNLC